METTTTPIQTTSKTTTETREEPPIQTTSSTTPIQTTSKTTTETRIETSTTTFETPTNVNSGLVCFMFISGICKKRNCKRVHKSKSDLTSEELELFSKWEQEKPEKKENKTKRPKKNKNILVWAMFLFRF